MAQQIIQNLESGLICRTKINENFTELYSAVAGSVPTTVSADFYIPSNLLAAIRAGTSTVDLSTYILQAVTAAGNYGKVEFGRGRYTFNVVIPNRVTFQGAGNGATDFYPFSTASAIITHVDTTSATWQYVVHSDFTMRSTAQTGIGLQIGPTVYVANCEFAGRYIIRNVGAYNFDKAVVRSFGQIGFAAIDCNFQFCNYDFHVRDATRAAVTMHGGNHYVVRGEYSYTQLAHLYMDSSTNGTGQIIYDGVIHEASPGFIFFLKNWSTVTATPTLEVRGCWNELNHTAVSVTIDGTPYTPKYIRAVNANRIIFNDTPISVYELVNSGMSTYRCNINEIGASTKDSSSTAVHRHAYADNLRSREFVESVDMMHRAAGNFTAALRMPHREGTSKAFPALYQRDCQVPFTTGGSASVLTTDVTTDGTTFPESQDLLVSTGQTLTDGTFTVPVDRYVVCIVSAKITTGNGVNVSVTGPTPTAIMGSWTSADWQTVITMTNTIGLGSFPAAGSSFYFTPVSGNSTIRLGGLAILTFTTEQAMFEFVSSGRFPA